MPKSPKSKSRKTPSPEPSEKITENTVDAESTKKITEDEKQVLKSIGMVVTNFDVLLGQKSEPISDSKGTKGSGIKRKIEPMIMVDEDGNYSSPLLKHRTFSSLTDLVESI